MMYCIRIIHEMDFRSIDLQCRLHDNPVSVNSRNPIVSILNLNPLNRRKNWIAELEWNVSR